MNMGSIDLSQLNALRPILPFPIWQKAAALVGGFVVIVGLYMYLVWLPLYEEIEQVQATVDQQQQILTKNRRLAANLPRKKQEFAELEKQLSVALKMLPQKAEIPDLLEDVSRAGMESGLFFKVFKPENEVVKKFYAEVPVKVEITGTYRQLLTFLKRVGEMPRIVDVKNIEIDLEKGATSGSLPLDIEGLAVTYRFVETSKKKKADNKGKKGGGRGR